MYSALWKPLNLVQPFIFRNHIISWFRSRDKVAEKYTDQGWLQNKALNIPQSIIKSFITKGNMTASQTCQEKASLQNSQNGQEGL